MAARESLQKLPRSTTEGACDKNSHFQRQLTLEYVCSFENLR